MILAHIPLLVGITIFAALVFNFLNGFHDAANAIATIVSTQVLKPHQAVLWSAVFNFLAYFVFGLHVADTVGRGIVEPQIMDTTFIFSALMGAIIWNIITWYYGLPSSSSHALIGGLIGAALIKSGTHYLEYAGIFKTVAAIVISPLLGMVLALVMMFVIAKIFFHYSPLQIDRWFRGFQLFSSALLSLGHGGNDAQKTMGIIAVLLFSSHLLTGKFYVPAWVIISCYLIMAIGTLFGGYRIVRTMGMKITKLKPVGGACAETGSALTLFIATSMGIPVSTTHIVAGSIVGVGSLQRFSAVRWGVASQIVWAWVLTLPASAGVAALVEFLGLRYF